MINIISGFCVAIILLLSLLGWGRLVAIATFGNAKGDWPLQAAWGTCFVALVGGLLNFTGLVSVPVNLSIVFLGFCLCLFFSRPRTLVGNWSLHKLPTGDRFAIALLALVSIGIIAASVPPSPWNAADDSIGYAAHPVKMLETGQLIEPFSFRRIVGFGGYAFLHSLILPFSGPSDLNILDKGIMTVLAGVLTMFYLRRRLQTSWLIACIAGIILMSLPTGRINLSPNSIMIFITLALVETFQLGSEMRLPLLRRAFILALVCGGFLSIRANALAVEGVLLPLLVVTQKPFSLKLDIMREKVALLGMIGLLTALFLLPWAVSLYRSSQTPFFPVIHGNWTGAIRNSAPLHLEEYIGFLARSIWYSGLLILLVATLIGAIAGAAPVEVICISAAAMATTIATVSAGTLFSAFDLWRYYGPFIHLAAVLIGFALFMHFRPALPVFIGRMKNGGVFALCLVTLARPVLGIAKRVHHRFMEADRQETGQGNDTRQAFAGLGGDYDASLSCASSYKAALASIPKGARILAQVDAPFLLDYRDHDIVNIDIIGAVSPAPGLPIGKTPEDLAKYLSSLSIRYLIYTKPENSLRVYRKDLWEKDLKGALAGNPYLSDVIVNFLWFFDAVKQLATQYPRIFENDQIVVLRLDSGNDYPVAKPPVLDR